MVGDVDTLLAKMNQWQKEMSQLRKIVLGCGLDEGIKWGQPCYTIGGKNVLILHGFKDYCAILFVKGALLKDPQGILVQQTDNVQAARQVRFTDAKEIRALEPVLRTYIRQAIEIEAAGLTVPKKKTTDFEVPDELKTKFAEVPALKKAFEALTPGRQRAYLLHFCGAKLSATRAARIDKLADKILAGKGLDD